MFRHRASWVCALALAVWALGSGQAAHAAMPDLDVRQSEYGHHHLSILFGGTTDREESAFTLGLDYEFRVNRFLGIGLVGEYAFDEISAGTVLAVVDLHLWRGLAVQTGPGVEFVEGKFEEGEPGEPREKEDDEAEFAYRIGVLYEFEFGRYTFSPQIHYDFTTGEDAVVYVGAFGVNF